MPRIKKPLDESIILRRLNYALRLSNQPEGLINSLSKIIKSEGVDRWLEKEDCSLLDWASKNRNLDAVKFLINSGANTSKTNRRGYGALHYLFFERESRDLKPVFDGSRTLETEELALLLIESGVPIEIDSSGLKKSTDDSFSILDEAVFQGLPDLTKVIISRLDPAKIPVSASYLSDLMISGLTKEIHSVVMLEILGWSVKGDEIDPTVYFSRRWETLKNLQDFGVFISPKIPEFNSIATGSHTPNGLRVIGEVNRIWESLTHKQNLKDTLPEANRSIRSKNKI